MLVVTRWLVITAAILLASWMVPGITVKSVWTAVFAAAVLGLINTFIKPVLIILTLPLNVLTLGIFTFFLNAFLLQLVAYLIRGFEVKGFWAAFLGALIISIVSWLANQFVVRHKRENASKPEYIDMQKGDDGKWRQP